MVFNLEEISTVQYQAENGTNLSILVTLNDTTNYCVPINLANIDYQTVLEWVAKGNTIADAE